jgi:hypothetical protein
MGSTGAWGRGASTIVTMINDRAELEKCEEKCEDREGGGGTGQNACTSPYIEAYRGKVGVKNLFCPRNMLRIPKPCCGFTSHPNNTPGTPRALLL